MSASISRRTLLAAAAGAVVATGSRPSWAAAAPLHLGIQMYSLRGYKVDEALRHARDLGFKFIEFYGGMFPVESTPEQITAMKRKVADLGLTISAHGVNGFGADAAANRRVFEFAKAAGIPIISADPAPESFASLDELVKEFDIRIAIHNHGPKHRYNKAVDVLRAIEKHDVRIGACADLGHYIRSGENPVEVIRLLEGRLYGIHLKDFKEMQDQTTGVILGKGHLDVPAVFAALEQVGFPADGALSLEYEEHPENPLADIRECLEVAKGALAAV
ncbi:MAG: sugar phosphate isomerase/epimerase [Planctomycetes bacterium]|nr:sugar phosphate isomerase/epimerase [Planctomycetota bacterium]